MSSTAYNGHEEPVGLKDPSVLEHFDGPVLCTGREWDANLDIVAQGVNDLAGIRYEGGNGPLSRLYADLVVMHGIRPEITFLFEGWCRTLRWDTRVPKDVILVGRQSLTTATVPVFDGPFMDIAVYGTMSNRLRTALRFWLASEQGKNAGPKKPVLIVTGCRKARAPHRFMNILLSCNGSGEVFVPDITWAFSPKLEPEQMRIGVRMSPRVLDERFAGKPVSIVDATGIQPAIHTAVQRFAAVYRHRVEQLASAPTKAYVNLPGFGRQLRFENLQVEACVGTAVRQVTVGTIDVYPSRILQPYEVRFGVAKTAVR